MSTGEVKQVDAKSLETVEAELKRDLEAIARVRQIIANRSASAVPQVDDRQLVLPIKGRTKPKSVETYEDDSDEAPSNSLRSTVEEIINSDPIAKWTTQKVLDRLMEQGYPLRAKKPVYSVGQSLKVLLASGKIRLTRKGSGREPNIYKAKIRSDAEGTTPMKVEAEIESIAS